MFEARFVNAMVVVVATSCTVAGCVQPTDDDELSLLAAREGLGETQEIAAFDELIQQGLVSSIDELTDEHGRPKFHFALFGSPDPGGRPYFDPTYFRPDVGTFKLQPGVLASEALDGFFASPNDYGMECATAISILHYAAVRHAFRAATGGDTLFDQRFTDMAVGRLGQGTENDIRAARKEVDARGMRLGDHAYFHNPAATPEARLGGWNGENVIVLGNDRYFGHPFGVTSSAHIIDKLNSVADPAIENPVSAYLGGPVYRLDAGVLWQTVKAYLDEYGPDDDSGNDGGDDDDCTNEPPPSSGYSCAQQAGWGKCGAAWMEGYCNASCDRCGSPPPVCEDVPPPGSSYSCEQQAGWGKCDESWMVGYCDLACGRCSDDDAEPPACTDVAPSSDYTCEQQVSWGKCGESWMTGFCNDSCGRCE